MDRLGGMRLRKAYRLGKKTLNVSEEPNGKGEDVEAVGGGKKFPAKGRHTCRR